jgi:nicotinamidase-related amidase
MKSIRTRVGTFLTGSEIADAVLHLSAASANVQRQETVDIPVVLDRRIHRARFMVGWMTDVCVLTSAEDADELEEPASVVALLDRAAMVGVRKARPFTAEEMGSLPDLDPDIDLD